MLRLWPSHLPVHHIIPYREEPHFRPEDMVLLCPNHHAEADSRAMSEEQQRAYKQAPRNIEEGVSKGLFRVERAQARSVLVGSNDFAERSFIRVDGETLFEVAFDSDGVLQLSLVLYDSSDERLAVISENEWVVGDPMPWDFEASFQYLRLRNQPRDIALELDGRSGSINLRAQFWRNGQVVYAGP